MKPKKFVQESDSRHLSSSLIEFSAPKDDNRVVHLCKPFVVLLILTSINKYGAKRVYLQIASVL